MIEKYNEGSDDDNGDDTNLDNVDDDTNLDNGDGTEFFISS